MEGILNFGSDTPVANRIFDEVWEGYKNGTLNLFRLGFSNANDWFVYNLPFVAITTSFFIMISSSFAIIVPTPALITA